MLWINLFIKLLKASSIPTPVLTDVLKTSTLFLFPNSFISLFDICLWFSKSILFAIIITSTFPSENDSLTSLNQSLSFRKVSLFVISHTNIIPCAPFKKFFVICLILSCLSVSTNSNLIFLLSLTTIPYFTLYFYI